MIRTASASAESPRDTMPPPRDGRKRILVVCYGNLCRSPFAAAMLERRLDGERFQILSAGTDAAEDQPVSEDMRIAAREHGIDLSQHRSRRINADLLRTCELVVAMSRHQVEALVAMEPSIARRVRLLGGFDPRPNTWGLPADPRRGAARAAEIGDPAGQDFEFHRQCCERLDAAVAPLSRWLLKREAPRSMPAARVPVSAPALGAARLR